MKHLTKLTFALLSVGILFSCQDKDDEVNNVKITVTPEALDCTPAEETKTITIQTDGPWIVSTQEDWIEILSPVGSGNGTAKVKIHANGTMTSRQGNVVVASNKKQVSVPVTQSGMDISVTPSTLKVSEKATTKSITVTCKGNWTAQSDAEWCKVEKEGNLLNISILYNQAIEERTANIEVKSEAGNTVTVKVTQSKGDGNPEPVFSVLSSEFEIPAKEEGNVEVLLFDQTYKFDVTTPSKSSVWDVKVSYPDGGNEFLTCKNIFSRVGDGQFTVTTKKNLTRQPREAVLEVVCNTNGTKETYKLNLKQLSYDLTMASVPSLDSEYGAEQSFGISIVPEMELSYESNVGWIKNIENDIFKIEDNITDKSREGKLYIKLAKDGSVIDSLEFSQIDGLQQMVPFACNSYVTPLDPTVVEAPACGGSIFGGSYVGDGDGGMKGITVWRTAYDKQNIQISFYFRTETPGDLNLGLVARMNRDTDTARVAVSIGDVSYDVEVTGRELKSWPVGKFKVEKAGYVRINIKGIYSNTTYYPYLSDMYLGGAAIQYSPDKTKNITYVTAKQIAASDPHWIRRGPSCHLGWIQPTGNTEWFYNEINVPVGQDVPAAYFMTTGGDGFYMGIQPNTKGTGKRNILFSVWNNENDPQNIKYSEVVRHGEKSKPNSFGHEGSGVQTWRYYDWDAGKTYATLVNVRPEVKDGKQTGNTLYTGYFWSEEFGWELIAEIRRPGMVSYYRGSYSFSENYGPHNGFVTRSVDFPNQWMRTSDGVWHEVLSARVTADGCGSDGLRTDFYGGVRDGHFYLQNIGYFDHKINSGTRFTRPASGKSAPDIDFDALSKLGVWVNP